MPVTPARAISGVPKGSERDRGGIAEERKPGGLKRFEAEADEKGRGNRDRRAKTGGPLDKSAETEGNQECLDAAVARQGGDAVLDDLELARPDRDVVDKNRIEDDPADGKEPIGDSVTGRRRRQRRRHSKDADGNHKLRWPVQTARRRTPAL